MRIEAVLAPLLMLLMLAIEAAVVGGAFALGAWIVWRLLEQRRSLPPPPPGSRGLLLPAIIVGVTLLAAIVFGLGRNTIRPVPWYIAAVPFVPFLAISLLALGVVWAVRRALRGTPH